MPRRHTTSVAIVGAGASGTLSAIALLHAARAEDIALDLKLIDPRPSTGRGVAYGTSHLAHLLNVPAARMGAVATDPQHFCRWLAETKGLDDPDAFVPRSWFGEYLEHALVEALDGSRARFERITQRVTEIHRRTNDSTIRLDDGQRFRASHVVLALGSPGGPNQLLPSSLLSSSRFIADPWAPDVLDEVATDAGDVLLLGTGLTTVDVALRICRPGRTVTALSRRGLLPTRHAPDASLAVATPILPDGPLSLVQAERLIDDHVRDAVARGSRWQDAIDALRPITNELWQRLSAGDQQRFVDGPMRTWEVARHRMAPRVGDQFTSLLDAGLLVADVGEVIDATEVDGGLEVHLRDGTTRRATTVISCTGATSVRGATGPLGDLVGNLEHQGVVELHALGVGLLVDDVGRARDAAGSVDPPLFVVGPLRRGSLWETTAIPEILLQATEVAQAIVESAPRPHGRRRPEDLYGQPLSTTGAAADLYNEALGRLLRVQSGALDALERSVEVDPGFALGHTALAVLGHEFDLEIDTLHHLDRAVAASRQGTTEREQRFIEAVRRRVAGDSSALITHVAESPRDVLAVSIAMPTIAFSGAYEVPSDAWDLLDQVAPSYVDDWWINGLLAFARQEQGQLDLARELATSSLQHEPRGGTAAHALAHVYLEAGQHEEGLAWLDPWVTTAGRDATHLAHFSWHAALHELALNDTEAVLTRFASQLAPGQVRGTRAMVDSASLLWRLVLEDEIDLPEAALLDTVAGDELRAPSTPFSALHAAVTLAVLGDHDELRALERSARRSEDPSFALLIAPIASALRLFILGSYDEAATVLLSLIDSLAPLGGSAAQRSIVEDTAIAALIRAGDGSLATRLLERRLDRRDRPKDHVLAARAHLATASPLW